MKKILLSCVVVSLLSSNAFAWEIHKGRLINEKKWTTSNDIQLTFDNFPVKKHSFDLKVKQEPATPYKRLMCAIDDSKGFVNALTPIKGEHEVGIINETDTKQVYSYSASICTDKNPDDFKCAYYSTEIELEPGGDAYIYESFSMQVIFEEPGTHEAVMSATLEKDNPVSGVRSESSTDIEIS